jgi:hypothetical protein
VTCTRQARLRSRSPASRSSDATFLPLVPGFVTQKPRRRCPLLADEHQSTPGPQPSFFAGDRAGNRLARARPVRLRELSLHRVDCIYIDLPLSHPAASHGEPWMDELGFFFGDIIPEAHGGDVLRLQYLNKVEIESGDVRTASNFGQELLETISREYKSK